MGIDFEAAMREEDGATTEITELDAAKNKLMQFRAAINSMQREATELTVTNEATKKRCAEMTAQVKQISKQIAAQQDAIIFKPQKFVKAVQSFTLPFRKDLEAIEAQLKRKGGDYALKEEMDRRKAEAEAQKAAAAAQKKIDREAKRAGIEPVQLPMPVIPRETGPVRTESGTSSTTFEWTYEVTSRGEIPSIFLADDPTDRTKVMAQIRAGVREIPGLRIFERPIVRTRTF